MPRAPPKKTRGRETATGGVPNTCSVSINNLNLNLPIATVAGIMALIGSIVAPTLWFGDIKQVNAVQDVRISTIEVEHKENREDFRLLNAKVDALLINSGINPAKVKAK